MRIKGKEFEIINTENNVKHNFENISLLSLINENSLLVF